MSTEQNIPEWENVRKNVVVQLVVVDATDIENKKSLIKAMSYWADQFRGFYEKLNVKCITDTGTLNILSTTSTFRELIVLEGVRKETEKEFRDRMHFYEESSWTVQYQKLTNCTAVEAKVEMIEMVKNGTPLTPEQWIEKKTNHVKSFLNLKS